MNIEFGLTRGPFNTKYAPLAALGMRLRQFGLLQPLQKVPSRPGQADFSTADKLIQVLISMLAGCRYIVEVNAHLRTEVSLARAWGFARYLEQSSLALALNGLNREQLSQLEQASRGIWRATSRALQHDWRKFLRFDLDLSGLPCGKGAEGSEKGYFSGKKTPPDANWPAPAPPNTAKPSGLTCSPAPGPAPLVSNPRCERSKLLST